VLTAFVGDASPIKITVKDLNRKTVDTLNGKVYSNYFRIQYTVKPNNSGGLYFEAEMKAHGLKGVSGCVRVLPAIKISDLKWEDGQGKSMTEAQGQQEVKMSAGVIGAPDGTPALINLFIQEKVNLKRIVLSTEVQVEGGRVECTWSRKDPGDGGDKKAQSQLNKTGEEYFRPKYVFSVSCLGIEATSPPLG
jgi:hypothetical protein